MSMIVVKSHNAVVGFFLRIVGKDPLQQAEQQRFHRNLKAHAEHEQILDRIMEDIDRINVSVKRKQVELEIIKSDSERPPKE